MLRVVILGMASPLGLCKDRDLLHLWDELRSSEVECTYVNYPRLKSTAKVMGALGDFLWLG